MKGLGCGGLCSMRVLSREQVRRLDRDAVELLGIPSLLLMENAARGLSGVIQQCRQQLGQLSGGRIVIIAGPGNNGGDGLAAARLLAAEGVFAEVFLLRGMRQLSADTAENLGFLQRAGLEVEERSEQGVCDVLRGLCSSDLVVDALLGTGLRGAPEEAQSAVIEAINTSGARVLAVDLPSGLDCDLGTAAGACVRADWTVTFAAKKLGFLQPESRRWTGEVQVCPIGIPRNWAGWPGIADC